MMVKVSTCIMICDCSGPSQWLSLPCTRSIRTRPLAEVQGLEIKPAWPNKAAQVSPASSHNGLTISLSLDQTRSNTYSSTYCKAINPWKCHI